MNSLRRGIQTGITTITVFSRRWSLVVFGAILSLVLALVLTIRFNAQNIAIGQPSPRSIQSPRDFTFESDVATEAARRQAANDSSNLVYVETVQVHQNQRQELQSVFATITSIRDNPSLAVAEQQKQIAEIPSLSIEPELAKVLATLSDEEWQRVRDQSNALYDRALRAYDYSIDEKRLSEIKTRYLPYNVPTNLSDDQRQAVLYFVNHTLAVNRVLDEAATQRRQNEARAQVEPVSVTVVKGENIVRQGDRVSAEQYEKLVKLGIITPSLDLYSILGRCLLALLVGIALSLYITLFYAALRKQVRALWVVGGLMVLALIVGRWFVSFWINEPEAFALAIISITLAVLFDGPLALVVTTLVALLLGFIGDGSYQLMLISLAGGIGGVLALRRADRAVQFVLAGLGVALGVGMTALVWKLVRPGQVELNVVLNTVGISLLNGVVSALIAWGMHNLLGRAAGIVTPTQLMELAHPNQPLLRRLMQEAPGTYHHSIVVSNLAEQAAERIGADPLLTRVGAYYHDVGKMLRPYFFTDNQYDRSNVHDDLDPKTSAKLIADHVIEGARLARKAGLPQQIIDFILQHHGQDVIKFFYQKALQEEDNPNIADYSYPGPKPQSKETAILMLADGVEATVRSREQAGLLISERDLQKEDVELPRGGQTIAQVVNHIIDMRVASGQLNESPLTLRDIQTIRDSFVKTLQGIYHPRVEYPKLTKDMKV